ncbi:MAG: DUF4426 domain-containing protein [Gammaproteobacteria bacterium]
MNVSKPILAVLAVAVALVACERTGGPIVRDAGRVTFGDDENYHDFGDYVIQVTALTTDHLPAEVAREYGIQRSETRAFLNVVILKKAPDGEVDRPVTGIVTTVASNLAGQVKSFPLREIIEEGGAGIYYIGEASITKDEILIFDIDVTPDGEDDTIRIRYQEQFDG